MDDISVTKEGYSTLRKIVKGNKTGRPLVVTFDHEINPIKEFDLHSTECEVLDHQGLTQYIDVITAPGRNKFWDDLVVFPDPYVSAKIIPTNLGEVALEEYEKNERRFKNSEFRSWIAVGISVIALLISLFV